MVWPVMPNYGYSKTGPSNIISLLPVGTLADKMVWVPALVCGQVALGDTRCGRSYVSQELAVVVAPKTELH